VSIQIDNAFIKQYEAEVKAAYQRMGAKLMNTVRRKMSVKGKDTTFQKVGKGAAGQKSKHGMVPLMSIDHTPVTCTLSDWYAGDYIDKLDELKTNIDERKVITDAGAYAMGRKSDELIVTSMSAATTNAAILAGATGLTQPKINLVFEKLGNNDVPDDGQRYFVIGPEGWTDLLAITAFSSSDFIGASELPYAGGMIAKRWMGFMWFPFTGLANGAGGAAETRALAYHMTAAGLASGQEIETDITWVGERQAHFVAHSMSQGAVNIDELGIQVVDYVK
jgi:hypothetical protein